MSCTALLWIALQVPPGIVAGSGPPAPGDSASLRVAASPAVADALWEAASPVASTMVAVLQPANGPRVIHKEMSQPQLVAIRLSIRVSEAPPVAGAASVLQELARGWLETDARKLGATVGLDRSPSHAIYSIVGPRESFEAMVELLRRAVERPTLEPARISAARARVEHRSRALLEVPDLRVRVGLIAQLFPTSADSSAIHLPAHLSPATVEWFRRRNYTPGNSVVVVVGAVSRDEALAAFRDWPQPPAPERARPSGAFETDPPVPQAVSSWAGIGWSASDASPSVLAVAAALVTDRLRARGMSRARAEVWWGPGALGLVALGAIPPGSGAESTRPAEALRLAVTEAADGATAQAVATVRGRLWRRFLHSVRTPQGLASMIGQFYERTGNPDAGARFLADLSRVDADRVGATLGALLERTPAVVEVRP